MGAECKKSARDCASTELPRVGGHHPTVEDPNRTKREEGRICSLLDLSLDIGTPGS